ncbi:unnamed protein product [Zymoseptoria tritici ST99CH_1A5]|uniref:Major facilitator superfamily (MFS) profile domain-containing protein n=1 Tax=Zymoseptoria tritici ST99CH_1A5 TaxID=1276529 RepID=A0A1Y6L9S3_ZYMTR|nr:unnamed protein product [Zymoseptoria tritici ST99CH_1A5]
MASSDRAESDQTPLLPESAEAAISQHPLFSRRRRVLLILSASIFLADFGVVLAFAPNIAIYEAAICRQTHNHPSPTACKSSAVQSELALITGIKDTFGQVPGVLLALPYGFTADRIGRRPILLLCFTAMILEEAACRLIAASAGRIPLRVLWAAPAMQVLGGGPQVLTSMSYAMLTDVFSPDERALVYYQLAAVVLIGEILAPIASAALMWRFGPWVPSLTGLSLIVLGASIAGLLPETMSVSSPSACPALATHIPEGEVSAPLGTKSTWMNTVKSRIQNMRTSKSIPSNIICMLAAFALGHTAPQSVQLVVQYASLRFSWSIAQAGLLLTLKSIVTLIIMLLVLPQLSKIVVRRRSASARDYRVSQISVWTLFIGAGVMASAAHATVFALGLGILAAGWGYYSALRSFAVALVKPTQIATINTAIAMASSLGTMLAGPILAMAFRRGIRLDGVAMGLPYAVEAVLLLAACCFLQCIHQPGAFHHRV